MAKKCISPLKEAMIPFRETNPLDFIISPLGSFECFKDARKCGNQQQSKGSIVTGESKLKS